MLERHLFTFPLGVQHPPAPSRLTGFLLYRVYPDPAVPHSSFRMTCSCLLPVGSDHVREWREMGGTLFSLSDGPGWPKEMPPSLLYSWVRRALSSSCSSTGSAWVVWPGASFGLRLPAASHHEGPLVGSKESLHGGW